jgi:hypothetical protein
VEPEAFMEGFSYFLIRVRRSEPDAQDGGISGVVERLGTGEKWSFGSGEELIHLVDSDVHRLKKMQPSGTPGKPIVS